MLLNELKPAEGSKRASKRIGRGHGSGWGKTAGKGHNGQKQRAGASIALHFEGGQMPLIRRIPKRGFTNAPFKKEMRVLNLNSIVNNFEDGETVNLETLIAKGILKNVKFISKKVVENDEMGYSRKEKKEYLSLNETYCVEEREYVANLKIIGNCEVNKKLNFQLHKISKKAKELIEAAGGSVELLSMKGYIRNEKKVASN